jgi:hypothetical protein
MMRDSIQIKILNALLDKYESSTFFKNEKQPTRRIMLRFYDDGKSDFPYYDIEQSERRISVNRAVIDMSEQSLIFFDWMKGEREHIISTVWLNAECISSAYKAAERESKAECIDKICLEIEKVKNKVKSTWASDFLNDVRNEITQKRDIVSAIPADEEERRLLLQAISAIDELDGSECTERLFSLRTFGDSKKFECFVKSRLVRILRKYSDNDCDAADEDILTQVGIVKYPEQFEFCGDISVIFDSGTVNYSYLPSGSVIYSTDLSSGRIVVGPSVALILTIENRANYIEYIRRIKTERELIVYHGGQYSPRKREFLRAVSKAAPKNCKWYHWSDIDYGGFLMLMRLRREIIRDVIPFRMNSAELEQYKDFVAPIKAQYAGRLENLKAHSELSDCCDCIDYMLKNRIRLEQEAMLIDL